MCLATDDLAKHVEVIGETKKPQQMPGKTCRGVGIVMANALSRSSWWTQRIKDLSKNQQLSAEIDDEFMQALEDFDSVDPTSRWQRSKKRHKVPSCRPCEFVPANLGKQDAVSGK